MYVSDNVENQEKPCAGGGQDAGCGWGARSGLQGYWPCLFWIWAGSTGLLILQRVTEVDSAKCQNEIFEECWETKKEVDFDFGFLPLECTVSHCCYYPRCGISKRGDIFSKTAQACLTLWSLLCSPHRNRPGPWSGVSCSPCTQCLRALGSGTPDTPAEGCLFTPAPPGLCRAQHMKAAHNRL